jgi:homopolymeric O-antigen transport system ATP-binding protein
LTTVLPAVRIVRVSKRYQLGEAPRLAGSFREVLVDLAKAPLRRMRRLSGYAKEGWFWALRDVSFDVQPGEVTAVIGRNGAGKSTLLKILSRITEPTEGRIELRGRVASLLEVGTGFHPDLTGRENVSLNGAILGMRRAEIRRKFDAIVDFAEVSAFIDTPVKHYSSGMYLRLAFSVAAHLDGEVLLVDEVLAVGDAAFQKKCLGKMREVGRAGRTVVFISHNMAAVSALCTRAIVLEGGRPVFDGTARDGVRQYLENNLADSALTWDLASTSRTVADLGSLVRLERVTALTVRGDGFRFAEPLRFRVSVVSTATLEHLECAIGLDDMFGSRVVTFVSDRQQISTTAGGRYNIDVTVPAFGLRPGRYLLSVSLYSGGHYHDYLVHFGALSIVPFHDDGEGHVDDQPDRGPIAVASQWRVSEIPTGALV